MINYNKVGTYTIKSELGRRTRHIRGRWEKKLQAAWAKIDKAHKELQSTIQEEPYDAEWDLISKVQTAVLHFPFYILSPRLHG